MGTGRFKGFLCLRYRRMAFENDVNGLVDGQGILLLGKDSGNDKNT
jgi:hypothetical protein